MTGIEFCKTVKSMAGGEFTYFTLLTSKREKDEVALGLDSGADDFLTKPVTPTELFARLRVCARGRVLLKCNRRCGIKMIKFAKH